MESEPKEAFAIWITGLPASGKSTLTGCLKTELNNRGIDVAVLESDTLRRIFTPKPDYGEAERERFYAQMVFIGALLMQHGVPVIFDATANRRKYREEARKRIPRLIEVFVDCPLDACVARDPKGIYRAAADGKSNTVPGLQASYEPPEHPDVVVRSLTEEPQAAAARVIASLIERGALPSREL